MYMNNYTYIYIYYEYTYIPKRVYIYVYIYTCMYSDLLLYVCKFFAICWLYFVCGVPSDLAYAVSKRSIGEECHHAPCHCPPVRIPNSKANITNPISTYLLHIRYTFYLYSLDFVICVGFWAAMTFEAPSSFWDFVYGFWLLVFDFAFQFMQCIDEQRHTISHIQYGNIP